MSMTDAAERVLLESSRGAPMHYRRISELAIERGWTVPGGATPEASLNAAITTEIKRRAAADREQRFSSHGRGFYGLASPIDPLGGAIEEKNAEVRQRLRGLLSEIDPKRFEDLMGQLLSALGFEDVVVTKYSGDGGIDLRARLAVGGVTDVRTAVQVKRWAKNVSGRTVRELRGGLGPHERGLVITLSEFTRDAQAEAQATDRSPISLVDGNRLIELLIANDIGVSRRRVTILELDEGSLFPSEDAGSTELDVPHAPAGTGAVGRSEKVRTVWPLPGGGSAWKQTLDSMLSYVAAEGPTVHDAIQWLLSTFEKANSEKVARSYWQVPRSFGLLTTGGEQMALTAAGAAYLETTDSQHLLQQIRRCVSGFDELLAELENRKLTTEQGLTLLNDAIAAGWQSDAQVKYRLGWLENLGVVEQRGGEWELVGGVPDSGRPSPASLFE